MFKKSQTAFDAVTGLVEKYKDVKDAVKDTGLGELGQDVKGLGEKLKKPEPQIKPVEFELAMNTLANALSLLGVNIANIKNKEGNVDPQKLQYYLGANARLMFTEENQGEIISLANALSEFASVANSYLPSNSGKIILDWLKKQIERGTDSKTVISKINQFIDDLSDRSMPKDEYVWALLTGNYSLASILKILFSFGKFDKDTYKALNQIQMEAVRQLGPHSEGLTEALAIMGEKGASNFQKILQSNRSFRYWGPVTIKKERAKQFGYKLSRRFMDSEFGDFLMENESLTSLLSAPSQAKNFIKGIGGY